MCGDVSQGRPQSGADTQPAFSTSTLRNLFLQQCFSSLLFEFQVSLYTVFFLCFSSFVSFFIAYIISSQAGITTCYGMDGLGIKSGWERGFPLPSRPALGPNQPPAQWVPDLFTEGKSVEVQRRPPTPSSAEVKESVELYFYSLSDPSCPVPL